MGKIDATKLITNLGGTGAAGVGILTLLPEKYQPAAAVGLAILSHVIGLVQESVVKEEPKK